MVIVYFLFCIFLSLFEEKNKDLYFVFNKNMVGGPSMIFHRYHEAGKAIIGTKVVPKDRGVRCQCVLFMSNRSKYPNMIINETQRGNEI